MIFPALILAVTMSAACALAARGLFHWFQLESYQFHGYFGTVRRNLRQAVLPGLALAAAALVSAAACILIAGAEAWPSPWTAAAAGAAALLAGWLIRARLTRMKAKKKFVLTARVKRLYGIAAAVWAALLTLFLTLAGKGIPSAAVYIAWPLLLPLWAALGGLCAWPVETFNRHLYFRDAQKKLEKRPDLIKIGVTGSYGKTSVKFILAAMLSEKYQVLATPASFNTPMGLSSVIRGRLQPSHQVFIAEMGARHRGDIRELCRLVRPTHGVLTSVGPQHLDTFGSLESIRETKYDLIRAVPPEGCRFFADDGGVCRELWERTEGEKRLASVERTEGADVWAEDIAVSPRGSSFRLCTPEGSVPCETKLLGRHNIQNILLAASVCLRLGLTLRQAARSVARVEPVEHRLQLMDGGSVTIIDDAFNASPKGAEAALDVLAAFPPRRFLITPGLVELGADEAAYNRALGERAARSADVAILVGRRHTQPIREGMLAGGLAEENIHTVGSLEEAAALMRSLVRAGDTVLFENDLPDNYTEDQ